MPSAESDALLRDLRNPMIDVAESDDALATYVRERMARAWDEGRQYGAKDMQAYHNGGSWDDDVPGCGPDAWDCTCPNPYRSIPPAASKP